MATSTVPMDTTPARGETGSGAPADGWRCPAERTLEFLSGKWRPMVIFWLLDGPLRFNALQRRLGGITHRTLSKTLKEMERDGLVARRDYGEIPPRVDYSLTARGRSLRPVLDAMAEWAADRHEADETTSAPAPAPAPAPGPHA
ncbi:MAG: helix-turn-helix domain-containing protein [Pseudomonadota bacterium]|nr:helix-turn-helix domain-containing protein [Pseudomonadota bacterium]